MTVVRHVVMLCCSGLLVLLAIAAERPCGKVLTVREALRKAASKDQEVVCVTGWLPLSPTRAGDGLIAREIVPIGIRPSEGKLSWIGIIEGDHSEYARELYKAETFSELNEIAQEALKSPFPVVEVVYKGVLLYRRGLLKKLSDRLPPDPMYDPFRNPSYEVELVVLEVVSAKGPRRRPK